MSDNNRIWKKQSHGHHDRNKRYGKKINKLTLSVYAPDLFINDETHSDIVSSANI